MNDFVIDDAAVHFAASKNVEYKARVTQRFETLIRFLQSHSLTTREILGECVIPNETTKLMRSDLTDEGFEVVRAGYDKWLRRMDSGKPITDISPLEKALEKQRNRKK